MISLGWDPSTSADPVRWSASTPARGQAGVTSLLIQSIFGGDLIRAEVNGGLHYFNRLPDGQIVDLTFDQFPLGSRYRQVSLVPRSYVLGQGTTEKRYQLLVDRVGRQVTTWARGVIRPGQGVA